MKTAKKTSTTLNERLAKSLLASAKRYEKDSNECLKDCIEEDEDFTPADIKEHKRHAKEAIKSFEKMSKIVLNAKLSNGKFSKSTYAKLMDIISELSTNEKECISDGVWQKIVFTMDPDQD